jgi:hypothetical protein
MLLEVKQWPESQEVVEDSEWFFLPHTDETYGILGDMAYARIIVEDELEKVEKLLKVITYTGSHYVINEKIDKYFKEKENG